MYFSTCYSPLYIVSKIGLGTTICFLNTHLLSNVVIVKFNCVLYPILVHNPETSQF